MPGEAVNTYRILSAESTVELEGRSSLHALKGMATAVTGTIELAVGADGRPDLDRRYGAEVSVPATSISWGGRLYDRETRRHLDARSHPTITVSLKDAAADQGTRYTIRIAMTIRGRTRLLEARATVHVDAARLVVEGEHVIDVRDFGIEAPKVLMLRVDPRVLVRARVVAAID